MVKTIFSEEVFILTITVVKSRMEVQTKDGKITIAIEGLPLEKLRSAKLGAKGVLTLTEKEEEKKEEVTSQPQ